MKKILGFLSITIVVVFWGVSFISTKMITDVIDPINLGFFRYVLAVLFVGVIVIAKRVDLRVTKADFIVFFLAGLLGIFLYSILESTALTIISAEAASIITGLTPMAMVIGNYLVYKERISLKELVLILLSIAGVFLVLVKDLLTATSLMDIVGYLIMLASIVSWTVYSLITKKVSAKYSGIKVTAIQSMIALVLFLPTLFVTDFPDFAAFTPSNWANLLFLGIICSGVCYYLYIHSVNVLGVIVPNMFLNFIPLITILVNVLFFQASIDLFQIIGGIIITGSMTLMTVDNLKAVKQA